MSDLQSGRYRISNAKTGTVIDLSGTDGRSIIGWQYGGGDNQHWDLERTGNGWALRNVRTGKYLGIDGGAEEGNKLVGVEYSVEWQIWPDEQDNSVYRLFVPGTNQNVDLSDHGNAKDGTPITLWGKWNGRHQAWRFEGV